MEPTKTINWVKLPEDNEQIEKAFNCDIDGNDIGRVEYYNNCGRLCLERFDCTTFTEKDGFCWLKRGGNPYYVPDDAIICGKLINRTKDFVKEEPSKYTVLHTICLVSLEIVSLLFLLSIIQYEQ